MTNTRHVYVGSTGKSIHARGLDHAKAVSSKQPEKSSNSMAKHMVSHHGQNVGFTAKVVSRNNSCLTRLIDESIRIETEDNRIGLANSKSEWGAGALVRWKFDGPRRMGNNQLAQDIT